MLQMIIAFILGVILGISSVGVIIIKVWGDDYK